MSHPATTPVWDRPMRAVVRRLSDNAMIVREFDHLREVAGGMARAARAGGLEVSEVLFTLNLAAGSSYIVGDYEYRILAPTSPAYDDFPVTP